MANGANGRIRRIFLEMNEVVVEERMLEKTAETQGAQRFLGKILEKKNGEGPRAQGIIT
jgi:hypothetical protein